MWTIAIGAPGDIVPELTGARAAGIFVMLTGTALACAARLRRRALQFSATSAVTGAAVLGMVLVAAPLQAAPPIVVTPSASQSVRAAVADNVGRGRLLYRLTNQSQTAIELKDVKKSCPCFEVDIDAKTLPPGGVANVQVRLASFHFTTRRESLRIVTSSSEQPEIVLAMEVVPDVKPPMVLTMWPETPGGPGMDLGPMARGETRRVYFQALEVLGASPWIVNAQVEGTTARIRTAVACEREGTDAIMRAYQFTFSTPEDGVLGLRTFPIVLLDASDRIVGGLMLETRIVPPARIEPESVALCWKGGETEPARRVLRIIGRPGDFAAPVQLTLAGAAPCQLEVENVGPPQRAERGNYAEESVEVTALFRPRADAPVGIHQGKILATNRNGLKAESGVVAVVVQPVVPPAAAAPALGKKP